MTTGTGWPRISIVCPSFQQGDFIEETIRSVALQNYPNTEFIVMDGGSRDQTTEILKKHASSITYWESKPDDGQAHALNKACAKATGDILGWINSDDYYLPGAFAAVAEAWRQTPGRLIFGDWFVTEGKGGDLKLNRERPTLAFQVAVGGRSLPSHATFWPRASHLPFDEKLRFTMDAEFFKRLTASGVRPRYIPRALGVFRVHPGAKTSTIIDVARQESADWSRRQPAYTHALWIVARALDRLQRRIYRS